MKFRWDKKYLYWGITAFSVVAASVLFYYIIFQMPVWLAGVAKIISIINPIIYGAIIAYLLNPLVKWFEKYIYKFLDKNKIKTSKRGRSAIRLSMIILSLCLAGLIIYGLLSMLIPEVIASITNIVENFPRYVSNVEAWITERFSDSSTWDPSILSILDQLSDKLFNWLSEDLLPQLEGVVKSFSIGVFGVFKFFYNVLIGIIISIYILASKENYTARGKRLLYAFFSVGFANSLIHNLRFIDEKFGGFFIGKIIDSAIIGVLCYIGTSILNMPYALLISVIVGVTNIIPFFGPFLGAIPSILLIFVVSPIKGLYFAIFVLALQQLDGNFIGPKILGESTGLSSFMVIVAILIGGGLFGVMGMFIAVPFCAVIVAFWQLFVKKKLNEKELPDDFEQYKNLESIDPDTGHVIPLKERKNVQAQLYKKDKPKLKTSISDESVTKE